jgi:hypothetical protein
MQRSGRKILGIVVNADTKLNTGPKYGMTDANHIVENTTSCVAESRMNKEGTHEDHKKYQKDPHNYFECPLPTRGMGQMMNP